jgi:Domain of unknown function (DUF222)
MSTLVSALDELRSEDLRFASDEEVEDDVREIERASRMLEAERARRIAAIDQRRSFERDGYLSVSAWLTHRLGINAAASAHHVRVARALDGMPLTRCALQHGEISLGATTVLVAARETNAEAFEGSEQVLVDAARTLPFRELRFVVEHWRQAADPRTAAAEADRIHELRRLHVSPTLGGMVRVDGDLDPETGQTFITALRAVQDADARKPGDMRTAAQRRADALGEICRRWLDVGERPSVAGERPHVVVTVDLEALERGGGRSELADVGAVCPETARRIACDAALSRVITRGRSEPLEVGRRTPVVPAGIRRAVVVRDRHCRFPGCDRPQGWCDAHHAVHWADGGETSLANLVLLCRPHHRLVHGRFALTMEHGQPVFRRSDGSVIEERPPP